MRRRAEADFRYTIERAAEGRRRAISVQRTSLNDAKKFGRNQLMAPAVIIEREVLPLGCEVIVRVGRVYPSGEVSWRKQ